MCCRTFLISSYRQMTQLRAPNPDSASVSLWCACSRNCMAVTSMRRVPDSDKAANLRFGCPRQDSLTTDIEIPGRSTPALIVTPGRSQKGAAAGVGVESLFTGDVFLAAHRTVMI